MRKLYAGFRSIDSTCVDDIVNRIAEQLIFCDIEIAGVKEAVCDLAALTDNILGFAYKLETMLRVILANGAKTKERPISMQDDTLYDKIVRKDELAEKNLDPLNKNVKHICLFGCGETILSLHSRGLIKAWSSEEYPELNTDLRTNVFALSEKAWSALGEGREVIKHIAASIDAASKDTFERLRCPAKWETVLENLAFIKLLRVISEIIQIRADILADNYELAIGKQKLMIDMHFIPDPDPSYKKIRVGRLKVR